MKRVSRRHHPLSPPEQLLMKEGEGHQKATSLTDQQQCVWGRETPGRTYGKGQHRGSNRSQIHLEVTKKLQEHHIFMDTLVFHPWERSFNSTLTMDSFSTKSLALQAQKKLMSKMATKSVASLFIDDTSSEVLDELYRVTKEYTRNRKESQKIIKNLIKMVVKLGVLYRNNQFNNEELIVVENFRKKVHTLAMTAVSFHQIEFTFDRRVMSAILNDCRDLLHQAIKRHLTAKSHSRINHVFNHFSDCDFLAALYGPSEVYRSHLQRICNGVNKMLDEGNL
ncbi:hypothetical protein WMY93_025071 [Mugilogobius chulae]|uniref:Tumor necrosis factor alpha-induced protein 8-like protein 1 n=1 Tax=Mugilogobius chulae TaxID=88201 RepID=A0AAW0N1H7_9GOBI